MPNIFVRINNQSEETSQEWKIDLKLMTKTQRLCGFIIPKATRNSVLCCDELVSLLEKENNVKPGHFKFIPLLESTTAVLQADGIAKASNRNIALNVGRYDLQSQMGCKTLDSDLMNFALELVAIIAKGNNLLTLMSTNCELENYILYEKECINAYNSGFDGRTAVTAAQVCKLLICCGVFTSKSICHVL